MVGEGILFDKEIAKGLNDRVQREIAPHLFLFCNYEPLSAYSTEGRFYMGINNFYFLLIDCSVAKDVCDMVRESERYKSIENFIHLFRTAIDHNESPYSQNDIDRRKFSDWLSGKMSIEGDFEDALKEIEKKAGDFYTLMNDVIDKIKTSRKPMQYKKAWEKKCVEYYKLNMQQFVVLGMISAGAWCDKQAISSYTKKEREKYLKNLIRDFYLKQTRESYKWKVEKNREVLKRLKKIEDLSQMSEQIVDKDTAKLIGIVREYETIVVQEPISVQLLAKWAGNTDIRDMNDQKLHEIKREEVVAEGEVDIDDGGENSVASDEIWMKADRNLCLLIYRKELLERMERIIRIQGISDYKRIRQEKEEQVGAICEYLELLGCEKPQLFFPQDLLLTLLPQDLIQRIIFRDFEVLI